MATTVKLLCTKDAHIVNSTSSNYNETSYVRTGAEGSSVYMAFFAFANTSIPKGARIISATFTGWVYSAISPNSQNFYVIPCSGSWSETGITGANKPITTYNSSYSNTISISGTDSTFTRDITNVANAWFNNPSFNYSNGFFIRHQTGADTTLKNIRSRTNSLTDRVPYIQITYDLGLLHYASDGAWKNYVPYYAIDGEWKQCMPYFGENGEWKSAGG